MPFPVFFLSPNNGLLAITPFRLFTKNFGGAPWHFRCGARRLSERLLPHLHTADGTLDLYQKQIARAVK